MPTVHVPYYVSTDNNKLAGVSAHRDNIYGSIQWYTTWLSIYVYIYIVNHMKDCMYRLEMFINEPEPITNSLNYTCFISGFC